MEAYLNLHDEEEFHDFSLLLEEHGELESESSFESRDLAYLNKFVTNELWDTEQELNGDMAVLPESGVASIIPKLENMKEDFAQVLTDWTEHIGYLQASDIEDIDLGHFSTVGTSDNNLSLALPENIFQEDSPKAKKRFSPRYSESKEVSRSSESDQSEIVDVVGLDTIKDITPSYVNEPSVTPTNESSDKNIDCKASIKIKIKRQNGKNTACIVSDPLLPVIPPKTNHVERVFKKRTKKSIDDNNVLLKTEKRQKSAKNYHEETSPESVSPKPKKTKEMALEAGDLSSLLEKFEATEKKSLNSFTSQTTKSKNDTMALEKKPLQTENEKLHKDIKCSLPKEVIDRIRASSRKKTSISIIPAMPNKKASKKSNGTRMQDAGATLSRNKLLKLVGNTNSSSSTNGFLSKADGSIQLDHDYCSGSSSLTSISDNNSEIGQFSDFEKASPLSEDNSRQSSFMFTKDATKFNRNSSFKSNDSSSRKDSGLESADMSDNSQDSTQSAALKFSRLNTEVLKEKEAAKMKIQENEKTSNVQVPKIHSALATSIIRLRSGALPKTKPVDVTGYGSRQMVSILKKPPLSAPVVKPQVIKQEPIVIKQEPPFIIAQEESNLTVAVEVPKIKEEMETVINLIEESPSKKEENQSAQPRKKLNLAEYRDRRKLNVGDSTSCPTELGYVYHASTSTEPIQGINDTLIWSENEIAPTFRTPMEIEQAKLRPKPSVHEIATQTGEPIVEDMDFTADDDKANDILILDIDERTNFPIIDVDERNYLLNMEEIDAVSKSIVEENRKQNYVRRKSISRSRSRSRSRSSSRHRYRSLSRSRSRNRSRSRGRGRRNLSRSRSMSRSMSRSVSRSRSRSRTRCRDRSRSRRRSSPRRRRISHRRSSISSNSSWSSRSRSHTRSSFRSRSRSSRSRSKSSSRSRSNTRSSSRYSSSSRSSYRSHFGRSRRSNFRSRESRERGWKSDRSPGNSRYYRYQRRSPVSYRGHYDVGLDKDKQTPIEERRVIYVGQLVEGVRKSELRRRFEAFGPIVDISLHFRDHGDNYGFVTFMYKNDAYEAVEHGNDDPTLPRYDLCFGGRRAFCQVKYADLDGIASKNALLNGGKRTMLEGEEENTFDLLLKEAQAKLRKRKA